MIKEDKQMGNLKFKGREMKGKVGRKRGVNEEE